MYFSLRFTVNLPEHQPSHVFLAKGTKEGGVAAGPLESCSNLSGNGQVQRDMGRRVQTSTEKCRSTEVERLVWESRHVETGLMGAGVLHVLAWAVTGGQQPPNPAGTHTSWSSLLLLGSIFTQTMARC